MPKKSDRSGHQSTMSNLLPDVSLEEGSDEPRSSFTELQNYRTTEEQNHSAPPDSGGSKNRQRASDEQGNFSQRTDRGPPKEESTLEMVPGDRPNLEQKLGPYVSGDVDEALEEVYLMLRRQFGGKATKSLIVEAALRYFLTDCLQREEESEIAKWMRQVLDTAETS